MKIYIRKGRLEEAAMLVLDMLRVNHTASSEKQQLLPVFLLDNLFLAITTSSTSNYDTETKQKLSVLAKDLKTAISVYQRNN